MPDSAVRHHVSAVRQASLAELRLIGGSKWRRLRPGCASQATSNTADMQLDQHRWSADTSAILDSHAALHASSLRSRHPAPSRLPAHPDLQARLLQADLARDTESPC